MIISPTQLFSVETLDRDDDGSDESNEHSQSKTSNNSNTSKRKFRPIPSYTSFCPSTFLSSPISPVPAACILMAVAIIMHFVNYPRLFDLPFDRMVGLVGAFQFGLPRKHHKSNKHHGMHKQHEWQLKLLQPMQLLQPNESKNRLISSTKQRTVLFSTIEDVEVRAINGADNDENAVTGASASNSGTKSNSSYSASQITVLSGLEPVRKRPGMYIGSTGPDGLHHLVYEVLDNSVDEALAGHASLISLVLHDEGDLIYDTAAVGGTNEGETTDKSTKNCITITDNGRGIPTDLHPTTQISALETVLTVLHAGGKFDNANEGSGYKVSGGLHGVGISVVNALSDFVEVRVDRKDHGERKRMRFERGVPVSGLETQLVDGSVREMAGIGGGVVRGVGSGDGNEDDVAEHVSAWERISFQTKESRSSSFSLGDDENGPDATMKGSSSSTKSKGKSKPKSKSKTKNKTTSSAKSKDNIENPASDPYSLAFKANLVRQLSSSRTAGTTVTFLPDQTVFKGMNGKPDISFDANRLAARLDEIAYLNAGLVLTLQDRRTGVIEANMYNVKSGSGSSKNDGKDGKSNSSSNDVVTVFHHAGGLAEYVQLLCQGRTPLFGEGAECVRSKTKGKTASKSSPTSSKSDSSIQEAGLPLGLTLSDDGTTILFHAQVTPESPTSSSSPPSVSSPMTPITIQIALRYSTNTYTEQIHSFVNNIRTRDGGSHVEGLKSCLTRTINQCARKTKLWKETDGNLGGEYVREGLTAIVSVIVGEPEFEGQTKGRLGNPEVRPAVETAFGQELTKFFDFHPEILSIIHSHATNAQTAALAAKAARTAIRRKTLLASTILPGKLADCSSRDSSETELFIVEGDSAAGSAKQGRDRRTQAILPLRGKILNIERAAPERIYQNSELQGLISACGLGMKGSELEEESLRYGKIVIMTDADVDGAHIRVLLLTFFFRYQRELVERGYLYIAQPPLYKIVTGTGRNRREKYTFSEVEKEGYLKEILGVDDNAIINEDDLKEGNVTIQRFKGLGEMMPKQLWETTMDPFERTLLQVTVNDCAMADQMLNVLMGDSVGPRRNFISERAENLKLGDLDV